MKFRVGLTPRAEQELREIAAWYRERSGSQEIADRWVDGILARLNRLELDPQRHALAREADLFDYDVRELLFGSGRRKTHRILFRVIDDLVEIMAIRHFAQHDVVTDGF
ncbi:MAG: type II toxin-antitoxin system RelE/ParE family toxin [Planctomycetaceae bacterium]